MITKMLKELMRRLSECSENFNKDSENKEEKPKGGKEYNNLK